MTLYNGIWEMDIIGYPCLASYVDAQFDYTPYYMSPTQS